MPRIAYLGPQGTFTEQAARAMDAAAELASYDSVPAALSALRERRVDAACVPVENSVEGSVPSTLDALADSDPVVAVAETVLPVRFSVVARPGTVLDEIRTVTTHPHAAAQVRGWLGANLPNATVELGPSTAAAAQAVFKGEAEAAVCAPVAIEHYPLVELARDVYDVEDAATRFLLFRRPGVLPQPTEADCTSIVAVVADRTGALVDLLTEFAIRGINLTRIESRPTKGKLGEYRFFLDMDGHVADEAVGDALRALHRMCTSVRFLGSYPRHGSVRPREPEEHGFVEARQWLTAVREGRGG